MNGREKFGKPVKKGVQGEFNSFQTFDPEDSVVSRSMCKPDG